MTTHALCIKKPRQRRKDRLPAPQSKWHSLLLLLNFQFSTKVNFLFQIISSKFITYSNIYLEDTWKIYLHMEDMNSKEIFIGRHFFMKNFTIQEISIISCRNISVNILLDILCNQFSCRVPFKFWNILVLFFGTD